MENKKELKVGAFVLLPKGTFYACAEGFKDVAEDVHVIDQDEPEMAIITRLSMCGGIAFIRFSKKPAAGEFRIITAHAMYT